MNKRQREKIYMECVKDGHWMADAPPSTPSNVTFGYVLRCERGCGTHRHLEIHPATGHVTHSHYDWTPEYKAFRESLGMSRAEVRLDAVSSRKSRKRRAA